MGTTEEELRHIVRDLGVQPYFLGTFDKTFPGFIHKDKMCCAIVNTAHRSTGGQHWLAMAWYPPSATFYLFDPFGFADQSLWQIYHFQYEGLLKRSALSSGKNGCVNLVKSAQSVQGPNSAACGLFCCLFLHAFAHWPSHPMDKNPTMDLVEGVPTKEMSESRYQPRLYENQQNLYRFLYQKSPFFKNNAKRIMSATSFNKVNET